jgi:FHS family Na+ dependent glucose MFS transporter 1
MAAAVLLACIPLAPWFWLLLLVMAGKGFAEGLIDTGANTLLVWTHGPRVGPYMNGLHFFFGLGAFLAPLLVAQLTGAAGGYRWAYWALAAFALLAGLRVATLGGSLHPAQHQDQAQRDAPGGGIHYPLVIAAALFLFFYVGAEVAFGGWVYTYAVTLHLADAAGAAYLTSGFWFAFTVGRLLSIPLATRFTPRQTIPAALCACLAVLALLIVAPGPGTVWFVAPALGFCMAPVWPTGFTLAGQSLRLTARTSSLILLGDSLGGMVLPWLVGKVIDLAGPQAMVALVLVSVALNLAAFVGMLRLGPRANQSA